MTAREFHYSPCIKTIGPRGGEKLDQEVWRRNGATQTWKTRPDEFRVPIKHGLRHYSQLWHYNAEEFHTAEDCDPIVIDNRQG